MYNVELHPVRHPAVCRPFPAALLTPEAAPVHHRTARRAPPLQRCPRRLAGAGTAASPSRLSWCDPPSLASRAWYIVRRSSRLRDVMSTSPSDSDPPALLEDGPPSVLALLVSNVRPRQRVGRGLWISFLVGAQLLVATAQLVLHLGDASIHLLPPLHQVDQHLKLAHHSVVIQAGACRPRSCSCYSILRSSFTSSSLSSSSSSDISSFLELPSGSPTALDFVRAGRWSAAALRCPDGLACLHRGCYQYVTVACVSSSTLACSAFSSGSSSVRITPMCPRRGVFPPRVDWLSSSRGSLSPVTVHGAPDD